jgi:hypothetical protein
MALSDEEKAQLEALTKKANEPDPEDDFEMEIFDGAKGARLPYSKGKSWLEETFGINLTPAPPAGPPKDNKPPKPDKNASNQSGGNDNDPSVLRHFRNRAAS